MQIKTPCLLGEQFITPKGIHALSGVSWFHWSDGVEFTYFYKTYDKWHSHHFFNEKNPSYETAYIIPDKLTRDGFLKEKKYPIKGRGYVCGLRMINNLMYAEILLTDLYYTHIYVPCNMQGEFEPNGPIIVPPSWDTEEKRKAILLKEYHDLEVVSIRL